MFTDATSANDPTNQTPTAVIVAAGPRGNDDNIKHVKPDAVAPSCQRHTAMVCSGSTPTDSSSFPVALK